MTGRRSLGEWAVLGMLAEGPSHPFALARDLGGGGPLVVELFAEGSLGGSRQRATCRETLEVRPWGVDVSSGVEARRGIKDPDMIHAFITAARAAARNGGNAA